MISITPFTVFAQSFAERVKEAYIQTDQNYDLDCRYSENKTLKLITPVSETIKGSDQISRDFEIESNNVIIPMSFTLLRKNRSFEYRVLINNTHISSAKLTRRDFYIAPIKDKNFANEFEVSKIYCKINFATAYPFPLTDGNYHISVHPHTAYDWQERLKTPIENYLNNSQYKSIILLEGKNYRGQSVDINKFLDNIEYKLEPNKYESDLEQVPFEVPLLVSPAGNNRFEMRAEKEVSITFTGGNHNYCIWNSTRHVIQALMNSKSNAKVNFLYDMNAIVAQPRGIEEVSINFNKRDVNRSNLLKDLVANKKSRERYHIGYLDYFRNYLAREYSGMYKSYKINYKAEGYETSITLYGEGLRDLEVNFNYL